MSLQAGPKFFRYILQLGLVLAALASNAESAEKNFRFHVFSEPKSLNPRKNESSSGSYLNQNLYRNLFWHSDKQGLIPDLAEKCQWSKDRKRLSCKLKPNLKWSDGSEIDSSSFQKNYFQILTPNIENQLPAIRADLLKNLVGYEDCLSGKIKKPEDWKGFVLKSKTDFDFIFSRPDPEFEFKLASTSLSLFAEDKFSGPYQLKTWEKTKKISLSNNSYYWKKLARPNVEVYFVADDSVALRLYQTDQLDFLRRLPSQYISEFKSRKDFIWLSVARLDYWAFGAELRDNPRARKLLSESLDFKELQKIYQSEGIPGCVGISEAWTGGPICLIQRTVDESEKKQVKWPSELNYFYSTQGGDDHKRTAEWMQQQWKSNLGLMVLTKGLENKIYVQMLKEKEPTIFRKGVAPDRPTCLAALESFVDPDIGGYQIKDQSIKDSIAKMSSEVSESKRKGLCHKILSKMILEDHLIVPTGPIHFAMLANDKFKSWNLNSLNYLDLSELQLK